ncbi:MAG TPA: helix-turn-helix transcriptional regulator [Amycolatopsis sp.]|uniref:helix-turn-helix domain-containing protein n=1 Tax=Amycolatopsis sp. TaxID=37632 RepID=UPI002B498A55|nr:helix-turn-helix transcriptional regulator [Amycolatopsis sp.]HKS45117.1 helix-turn-helix transcriptional regulator [Amycolatopsis sp.]
MSEAPEIGRTLRQIRLARGKSLAVIAGLAGISVSYLSRLESGERALDRRSLIVALANALEVAPSELIELPVPAPGDGNTNGAVQSLRVAMMSVSRGLPGGQLAKLDELRDRAHAVERADYHQRGVLIPSLVRDVHTTLAAGHDRRDLLELAVMLHAQTVRGWLYIVGAPLDLRWQAATLARQAAEDLEDPTALGVVAWASVVEMLASGAFDLAQVELDAAAVPTDTSEGLQLNGMLALSHALVAAADNRLGDIAAPLEHAADIAQRTGQGNAFRMGFGPVNVGLWRIASALEAGDADTAIEVAQTLHPEENPSRERQATFWMDYGRALAGVRRRDEAVKALRKAESLHPLRVLRNRFARQTIAELVSHAKRDAVGRELRGMAYRAGLHV